MRSFHKKSGMFSTFWQKSTQIYWKMKDRSYLFLILGIFGFKFLEWLHSEEGEKSSKLNRPIIQVPPPEAPDLSKFINEAALTKKKTIVRLPKDSKICPLCQNIRTNDTASISGFVFCYPCIFRWIQENKTCPITNIPSDTQSLVKLFINPSG